MRSTLCCSLPSSLSWNNEEQFQSFESSFLAFIHTQQVYLNCGHIVKSDETIRQRTVFSIRFTLHSVISYRNIPFSLPLSRAVQ